MEILKELQKENEFVRICNIEFIEKVNITSNDDYKCLGAIFCNCKFLKGITFENIDLRHMVFFRDCESLQPIEIKNCSYSLPNHSHDFAPKSSLYFSGGKFEQIRLKSNSKFPQGIYFGDATFDSIILTAIEVYGDIIFSKSKIDCTHIWRCVIKNIEDGRKGSIRFENKNEIDLLDIKNCAAQKVSFIDAICSGSTNISKSQIHDISLTGSIFNGKVEFYDLTWDGKLSIEDSKFKKQMKVELLDELNNLEVFIKSTDTAESTEFADSFIIEGKPETKIKKITLTASRKLLGSVIVKNLFVKESIFSGNFQKDLNIFFEEIESDSISFNGNFQKEGNIVIKNTKAKKVHLEGLFQKDATLLFDIIQSNILTIQNFTNQGNIQFNSLKPFEDSNEKQINVLYSDLGNTRFFHTNFRDFKRISIAHSNLSQILSADCKWFGYEQLENNLSDSIEKFETQREVFRQLKYAMDKQGDRIQSLVFKQYEMQSYKTYLENTVKKPKFENKKIILRLKNVVKNLIQIPYWLRRKFGSSDRIILTLGSTNDFGQNWVKAVWFLLGFAFFFYCMIVLSIHTTLSLSLKYEDWKFCLSKLWEDFGLFPQLLNPTIPISKMVENVEKLPKKTYFFDFFHKIVLSFFIYQVIIAFRKYSGKSE